MPFNLSLFSSTGFAPAVGVLAAIDPTPDPYLQVNTTDKIMTAPHDMQLLGAFCGSANMNYARVASPTLARTSYMGIVPTNAVASGTSTEVGLCVLGDRPLRIPGGEGISIEANTSASTAIIGALILGFNMMRIPAGDAYWIQFFSATSAAVLTWTRLNLTSASYPASPTLLPAGTYAIIGMDHFSATAAAARLILEGVRYRPGVISHDSGKSRTHDLFQRGQMGVWGYFTTRNMPDIVVFCASADASHSGFLYVVRVGDADMLPQLTGSV